MSGTITAELIVTISINDANDLQNFMNNNLTYGNILNNINVDFDLKAQSYKVLTGNNIKITKQYPIG